MTDFFSHTRVRPVAEEGCVCGGGTGGGGGFDGCSRSLRVETSRVEISRRKSASSEKKEETRRH